MVAQACIAEGIRANLVLKICQISPSSYYYKPQIEAKKVGKPFSTFTRKVMGSYDNDSVVVEEIIKLLALPFVDYGYLKTTFYLRDEKNYLINPKKVYRLMAENGLLCDNKGIREHSPRQWVKELVPKPIVAFSYFEFDIKYIYIQGKQRNAQVLTVLDVFSRWNMGHLIKWDMRQNDVIKLFDQIFENYDLPTQFYVRNDNGSQFIADSVQQYFKGKNVIQEFTKPATPEQNAHIESYHSIMERVVCKRYEFGDLKDAIHTMNEFIEFYNFKRIHSGVKYKSPYKFLLNKGIDMKNQKLKANKYSNLKTENSVQELGG